MKQASDANECGFTRSSGNVFEDIGLPEASDLLAKAELAVKILSEIDRRGLAQKEAATLLGVDQPKISALRQGKLTIFSIERLIRFLLLLGRDVEIRVLARSRRKDSARLRVAS